MIKSVLQSIEGIGIYPTISLLIFLVVFILMLVKVFLLDKRYTDKMKNLPLEKEESGILEQPYGQ